jgi:arylsulfatase A-like enzyme
MQTRREFLKSLGLGTAGLGLPHAVWAEPEGRPPNIVAFLADDMGYGDCRVYNPKSRIPMPNLERLAAAGLTFTDAHSSAALCAPTRYSLLTGNHPWRGQLAYGTWDFWSGSQIRKGQRTIAELLKKAGYNTAMIGKSHIGSRVHRKEGTAEPLDRSNWEMMDFSRPLFDGPRDHGFDYTFTAPRGIQNAPYAFFENDRLAGDPKKLKEWQPGRYGNSVIRKAGFGTPDWDSSQAGPILTQKAIDFIDRHHKKNVQFGGKSPFFLYYASTSCHVPHTPPETLLGEKVKGVTGVSAHADMVYELDVTLGRLVEALETRNMLKNTLVIFTSDNGGLNRETTRTAGHDSNAGLRGQKGGIYEGGHRVPFIVRWGDGTAAGSSVPPGGKTEQMIGLHDLFATLAAFTGQTVEKGQGIDSVSFLPVLKGDLEKPVRRHLLVNARGARALRQGSWKLIVTRTSGPVELYNLADDPGEERNRIKDPEQAERVKGMSSKYRAITQSARWEPKKR